MIAGTPGSSGIAFIRGDRDARINAAGADDALMTWRPDEATFDEIEPALI